MQCNVCHKEARYVGFTKTECHNTDCVNGPHSWAAPQVKKECDCYGVLCCNKCCPKCQGYCSCNVAPQNLIQKVKEAAAISESKVLASKYRFNIINLDKIKQTIQQAIHGEIDRFMDAPLEGGPHRVKLECKSPKCKNTITTPIDTIFWHCKECMKDPQDDHEPKEVEAQDDHSATIKEGSILLTEGLSPCSEVLVMKDGMWIKKGLLTDVSRWTNNLVKRGIIQDCVEIETNLTIKEYGE